MEIKDITKYGPHMALTKGWIAQPGKGEYGHRFGGDSWTIAEPNPIFGGATLLFTLDLKDPGLESLYLEETSELPLCSYINCDVWNWKQEFDIQPGSRRVRLLSRSDSKEALDPEYMLPNPLLEKPAFLREMKKNEYPVDENSYWKACDEFLGGAKFIRVLGPPIWLQGAVRVSCSCGLAMKYVACIGYEFDDNHSGFIEDEPFFIGEGALYFFLCKKCLKLVVISQPVQL